MASTPDVDAGWYRGPAFLPQRFKNFSTRWRASQHLPVRPALPRPSWTMLIASVIAASLIVWAVMQSRIPHETVDSSISLRLSDARQAVIDRHYVEPADRSAVHYYQQVLALDPKNAEATASIKGIVDRVMADAEQAIARGKLADAAVAIESIRRVRPGHPQLGQLESLLRQEQERLVVLASQEMVTLPKVQPIPVRVRAPAPPAVAKETETPAERTETRALGLARQRMAAGLLISPANDSAKFHLLAARRAAPENLQVRAAQRELRAQLVAAADQALVEEKFDIASQMLREAQALGLSAREVSAFNAKLDSARQGDKKADLLQLVLQRTQDNHLMEPMRDSATDYLQQLGRLDRRSAGYQRGLEALGTRLVANAHTAIYLENYERAARLLAHARSIGFNSPDLESADGTVKAAIQNPKKPLTAAEMRGRIKYVEPEYPAEAKRAQIKGWVDVTISIAPDGEVVEARVAQASHPGIFDRAAVSAARRWRYEPRPSSGRKDLDILQVRLDFQDK